MEEAEIKTGTKLMQYMDGKARGYFSVNRLTKKYFVLDNGVYVRRDTMRPKGSSGNVWHPVNYYVATAADIEAYDLERKRIDGVFKLERRLSELDLRKLSLVQIKEFNDLLDFLLKKK